MKPSRLPLSASLLVLALAVCSGCRRPEPPPPKPTPAVDTASAATGSADAGLGGLGIIQAADLKHVDPLDLLAQARKIAMNRDPHAVLVEIAARHDMTAGMVDVTERGITYKFEWFYFDKSQPPGKDTVDGELHVLARWGRFIVQEKGLAHTIRTPSRRQPPGQTPHCSGREAWKAAVRSGMPENAVASLRYDAVGQTWTFRVDGHSELTRVVNDATCTVGAVGGQPRPSGFPGAPPPTGELPF